MNKRRRKGINHVRLIGLAMLAAACACDYDQPLFASVKTQELPQPPTEPAVTHVTVTELMHRQSYTLYRIHDAEHSMVCYLWSSNYHQRQPAISCQRNR